MIKKFSAEELASLEGDATPFASAPKHFANGVDDWNKEFDKLSSELQKAFTKTLEKAIPHLERDLKELVRRAPNDSARAYASLEAARIRKQIIGLLRKEVKQVEGYSHALY